MFTGSRRLCINKKKEDGVEKGGEGLDRGSEAETETAKHWVSFQWLFFVDCAVPAGTATLGLLDPASREPCAAGPSVRPPRVAEPGGVTCAGGSFDFAGEIRVPAPPAHLRTARPMSRRAPFCVGCAHCTRPSSDLACLAVHGGLDANSVNDCTSLIYNIDIKVLLELGNQQLIRTPPLLGLAKATRQHLRSILRGKCVNKLFSHENPKFRRPGRELAVATHSTAPSRWLVIRGFLITLPLTYNIAVIYDDSRRVHQTVMAKTKIPKHITPSTRSSYPS